MPKIRITKEDGTETVVDTDNLDSETKIKLRDKIKDGSVSTQLVHDNKNILPLITNILKGTEGFKEVGANPETSPAAIMEGPLKRAAVGAASGALGGPASMGIGALANMALGRTPETFTDAGVDVGTGMLGGALGSKLATMKGLQTIPRQIGTQGLMSQGVTNAGGTAQSFLDNLLDPNRSVSDTKLSYPKSPQELLPALLGMLGGGASQYVKDRINTKSPITASTGAFNTMTGENQTPPDMIARMKEIQQSGPNASTALSPVQRTQMIAEQKAKDEMAQQQKFKAANAGEIALTSDEKYQAQRENKSNVGKAIVEDSRIRQAQSAVSQSDNEIEKLNKQLQNAKTMEEFRGIQDQIDQHEQHKTSAQQYISGIASSAQQRASDITLQKYEVQNNEGQTFPANIKSAEANTKIAQQQAEKTQSDIQLITLKRNLEKTQFGAEVGNVIKSSKNSEDLAKNLMNSDPYVITKFMDQAGKKFPNIKEGMIGEVLRQSWDPNTNTFANFTKMFGDQGTGGNVGARLEAVLGSKDKAYKVLDFIGSLDKGLKTQATAEGAQKTLLKTAAGTLVVSLAAITAGYGKTLPLAHIAAGEVGTLAAIQIPKIIDHVIADKGRYDMWKKWAESGFNSEMMKVGSPIYQGLMDMGDHYKYDENGNPSLIKAGGEKNN